MNFKSEFLQEWEASLRGGEVLEVQRELESLTLSSVPRRAYAKMAELFRRAGLNELGLRLLTPVVRPRNKGLERPSAEELLEYAVLLQRVGSIKEARQILSGPELKERPESLLYQAYGLFNEWRYREALPLLEAFLNCQGVSDYQKLIGRINLMSIYAFMGNLLDFEREFVPLEKQLKSSESVRLLANLYEIQCGLLFRNRQFEEAEMALWKSEQLVKVNSALDSLFVQKWRLILESHRSGNFEKLFEFKEEARTEGLSEVERDSDFHLLMLKFDPRRADYLYVGTPHASYREFMIESLHAAHPEISWYPPDHSYTWGLTGDVLSLIDMEWRGKSVFKKKSLQHRSLLALTSDLYQPQGVGALFSALYPGEHFDVDSSTLRVHQLIKRLRERLEELEIPLEISLEPKGYKIKKTSVDCRVLLPLPKLSEPLLNPQSSRGAEQLEILRGRFGSTMLKTEECAEILKISRSSAQRLLRDLVDSGDLVAVGAGRGKIYRLAKS